MKIRLLYVKNMKAGTCVSEWEDLPRYINFIEGEEYNAIIDIVDKGIRFEYPNNHNHYTLPYNLDEMEEFFISAFDKETYDKIYTKGANCKMFIGSECINLGEVMIKKEI